MYAIRSYYAVREAVRPCAHACAARSCRYQTARRAHARSSREPVRKACELRTVGEVDLQRRNRRARMLDRMKIGARSGIGRTARRADPVSDVAAWRLRITSYNVCYTKLLRTKNSVSPIRTDSSAKIAECSSGAERGLNHTSIFRPLQLQPVSIYML